MLLWILLSLSVSLVSGERIIESRSLKPCMTDSKFTASLFQVFFTPDNRTLHFDINGVSSIKNQNVTAILEVYAYGYKAIQTEINPCDQDLRGMCPMTEGVIDLNSNIPDISQEVIDQIPGVLSFPALILRS